MYSLKRMGVKLGLDKIRDFLDRFGRPQEDFGSIIVGGTNGKGSVCQVLYNILLEADYDTGLYVSPHLTYFEERIQRNGEKIKEEELWELIEEVEPEIRDIEEEDVEKRPSFFEVLTTLAFLHFSRRKTDLAVLEVGMGGRLDATNVGPHELSAVTYVGFDHSKYLGDTKKKIAYEKAGIIREDNYFVTGEKDPEIRKYFEYVCEERGADFHHAFDRDHEILEKPLRLRTKKHGEMKINGIAPWQAKNVLIALSLVEGLREKGYDVPKEAVVRGVENTRFPGRMETVDKEPWVMMDSAHNTTGIETLAKTLKDLDYDRLLLVMGVLGDKDYKGMVEGIEPYPDRVFTCEPNSERKLDSEKLAEAFKDTETSSFGPGIEALEAAKEEAEKNDLILVTGSTYLLGDIRREGNYDR